jgi:PAS domain S-box-containing protein
VVENDIPAGECARALVAGDLSPRNLLFAPLVVRGSPVGLLTVSNKPEGFDERDVRLGRAFAELAAIALANYQTLQLLETSEERFRSVVQNANDAMITLDKDGKIVFWNRAAELMFGCPGETIAGLPFTALLDSQAAGESASETWQERLEKASAVEGKSREAVGLRRDGSRFPLEYSFAPWNSREGLFVTASVRDLTARQQAHSRAQQLAALEERQRLARELHDSVSQALYGIALGANTALTQLDTSRARTVEALDYVISLADLALTEMRALIFDLRPESLEREGLAAGLTKHISALRVRYGIEITCDIPEEPAVPLSVKETVYGIVREALQNAVKHSQSTHINVRLARGPHALDVEVSDDGAGFDPEQPYPGHLGLASMRERAALAHGILEVASGHGQGTCVTARIPLAASSTQLG